MLFSHTRPARAAVGLIWSLLIYLPVWARSIRGLLLHAVKFALAGKSRPLKYSPCADAFSHWVLCFRRVLEEGG